MKTVFSSNSSVAHIWANKEQTYACTPTKNFYFKGDEIFSYGSHFCIAKHVSNEQGSVVLFTDRSYSNTTAKHILITSRACSHFRKIYCPYPDGSNESNFREFGKRAEHILKLISKARKQSVHICSLYSLEEQVCMYAEFFGIEIPEYLNKLFRSEATDELKEYNENRVLYIFKINSIERKRKEEREQKRNEREAILNKERIEKWLNFEIDYLYCKLDGRDLIRYHVAQKQFETSQGVKIPVSICRDFYLTLINDQLKVGAKLINYTVLQLSDGVIRIGCHTYDVRYLREQGDKVFVTK